MKENNKKLSNLIDSLRNMESVLLAFSGGVDSAFLLKALQLSGTKCLAITASSQLIPGHEVLSAAASAKELGIEHRSVEIEPFTEDFLNNSTERCFFCKTVLFENLTSIARREGYQSLADGSNADDAADFRPGEKAAIKYGVRSPLREIGLSKNEIRELSRQLGLQVWNKPPSPCLATRIPYGHRITSEALRRIERSEDFLRSSGFRMIRVRDYGDMARIEIGEDEIDLMLDPKMRRAISETLKLLGYKFISLDLEGYQAGSMNRVL